MNAKRNKEWGGKGVFLLFAVSFAVWLFLFRDFLFCKLDITSDAISYYEHTKFYLDNLAKGVIPLWDPQWNFGSNNDFFLMRIGCFNPFLALILIFHKIFNFPFKTAYLLFHSFYFFLGTTGFYMLARDIFRDRLLAFTAFLLLLFSSMGTRIFDSYIVLVFVPMIWFFCLIFRFCRQPQKSLLVGMTFTIMLLLTTYIPFYFLTCVILLAAVFFLVYASTIPVIWRRWVGFVKENKLLVLLCLGAIMIAVLPGILFFIRASQGEMSLPGRQSLKTTSNVLGVHVATIGIWSILEEIFFSYAFLNELSRFKFAVFYIPLFGYLLLISGAIIKVNKRILFFVCSLIFFFLLSAPKFTPLYKILYQHVFYFKYFRNFHFFLWFAVLPLLILLMVDILGRIFSLLTAPNRHKAWALIVIWMVHIVSVVLMIIFERPIASSFLSIGGSLAVFHLYYLGIFKNKRGWLFLLLFFIILIQPLQVYHYFSKNVNAPQTPNRYDNFSQEFLFTNNDWGEAIPYQELIDIGAAEDRPIPQWQPRSIYYAMRGVNLLNMNINHYLFRSYFSHKFVAYDAAQYVQEENFIDLEKKVSHVKNIAYVPKDSLKEDALRGGTGRRYPQFFEENSPELQVLAFDANSLKIKTDFPKEKFLVYHDAYHSKWQAFINGSKTALYPADTAFKGVWVPPGENILFFRFGKFSDYVFHTFCLVVFSAVFISLIIMSWKEERRRV